MNRLAFFAFLAPICVATSDAGATSPPVPQPTFFRVRVPATTSACDVAAQELAARFHQITGTEALSPKCSAVTRYQAEGREYEIYTLDFYYPTALKLENVTVDFGYSYVNSNTTGTSVGLYPTYEACLADMAPRTQEFENETQLPTLAASCARGTSGYEPRYVLTLVSFGKPKKQLQTYDSNLREVEPVSVTEASRELITRLGGKVVATDITRHYFYRDGRLDLAESTLIYLRSQEACSLQLNSAQSIISKVESKASFVGCLPIPRASADTIALFAIWEGRSLVLSRPYSERYYSLDECLSDRERVLESLSRTGRPPLGALCQPHRMAGDPNDYSMEIFEKF